MKNKLDLGSLLTSIAALYAMVAFLAVNFDVAVGAFFIVLIVLIIMAYCMANQPIHRSDFGNEKMPFIHNNVADFLKKSAANAA